MSGGVRVRVGYKNTYIVTVFKAMCEVEIIAQEITECCLVRHSTCAHGIYGIIRVVPRLKFIQMT